MTNQLSFGFKIACKIIAIKNPSMLTQSYPERFCIDNFINECNKLNWLEMFVRCQNSSILAERTRIPERLIDKNEIRNSFAEFTNQFCYIITKNNRAVIPEGMSTENFLKLRPIIERLVSQNELKEDWLKLY